MKVWILSHCIAYEVCDVEAVYGSAGAAMRGYWHRMQLLESDRRVREDDSPYEYEWFTVEDWEVVP